MGSLLEVHLRVPTSNSGSELGRCECRDGAGDAHGRTLWLKEWWRACHGDPKLDASYWGIPQPTPGCGMRSGLRGSTSTSNLADCTVLSPPAAVLLLSCCRRDTAAFPSTFTLLHLENVPVKQRACPKSALARSGLPGSQHGTAGMAAGRGEKQLLGKGRSQALAR